MVKIPYVIFISILFILTSGLNGQDFKILFAFLSMFLCTIYNPVILGNINSNEIHI